MLVFCSFIAVGIIGAAVTIMGTIFAGVLTIFGIIAGIIGTGIVLAIAIFSFLMIPWVCGPIIVVLLLMIFIKLCRD